MFRCAITGRLSQLGEAQHKVTLQKRPKDYYNWVEDPETEEFKWSKVSTGWEIAKEVAVCEDGLKLWESWTPEQQEAFAKSLEQPTKKQEDRRRVMR